jgi:aspartate racemase
MIFEELQAASPIPLISIIDPVCKAISKNQQKKVALFGTKMTMTLSFYYQLLSRKNIEVISPFPEQIEIIHRIISTELEKGIVKRESKEKLLQIISELKKQADIQGVILGCTELPLILRQTDCHSVTVYDTVKLHVQELLVQMEA